MRVTHFENRSRHKHKRSGNYEKNRNDINNFSFLFILSLSCNKRNKEKSSNELSIFDKVDKVPDSIKIDDIIIYNLFKYQILAHKNNLFDSTLIINKVYNSQLKIWKGLYGVLFDHEMFTTTQGMVKWNKEIFHENKDSIESRVLSSALF